MAKRRLKRLARGRSIGYSNKDFGASSPFVVDAQQIVYRPVGKFSTLLSIFSVPPWLVSEQIRDTDCTLICSRTFSCCHAPGAKILFAVLTKARLTVTLLAYSCHNLHNALLSARKRSVCRQNGVQLRACSCLFLVSE